MELERKFKTKETRRETLDCRQGEELEDIQKEKGKKDQ